MKDIFICSHSKKSKFGNNLSKLTPWRQLLEDYGCMKHPDIRVLYDRLLNEYTANNLLNLLDVIDTNFKEISPAKVSTIYEVIGKTDYKRISVDYDGCDGDRYVDYYLMDI